MLNKSSQSYVIICGSMTFENILHIFKQKHLDFYCSYRAGVLLCIKYPGQKAEKEIHTYMELAWKYYRRGKLCLYKFLCTPRHCQVTWIDIRNPTPRPLSWGSAFIYIYDDKNYILFEPARSIKGFWHKIDQLLFGCRTEFRLKLV